MPKKGSTNSRQDFITRSACSAFIISWVLNLSTAKTSSCTFRSRREGEIRGDAVRAQRADAAAADRLLARLLLVAHLLDLAGHALCAQRLLVRLLEVEGAVVQRLVVVLLVASTQIGVTSVFTFFHSASFCFRRPSTMGAVAAGI